MEQLIRFFDGYNRTARLYPALLTLAPIVLTVALAKPDAISAGIVQATVSAVVVFGGTYLLASVARSRGKIREQKLLKLWGGWATTILLRHSDSTIDPETKARYHRLLEALTGKPLPTRGEELLDTEGCDHRYRAATTQLMEARRDSKYKLVHAENASYGFRRNLLGLRPVGIAICLCAMLIAFIAWQVVVEGDGKLLLAMADWDRPVPMNLLVAFILDFVFALLWLLLVTPSFVRQAANEYALALFRTLDEPNAAATKAVSMPSDSGISRSPSPDGVSAAKHGGVKEHGHHQSHQ